MPTKYQIVIIYLEVKKISTSNNISNKPEDLVKPKYFLSLGEFYFILRQGLVQLRLPSTLNVAKDDLELSDHLASTFLSMMQLPGGKYHDGAKFYDGNSCLEVTNVPASNP